jgi:hypothetical protein
MQFLGITVDTVKLTLEVTLDRVTEISLLVEAWLRKEKASLRDLQSLLGKLHFVSTCVRPGKSRKEAFSLRNQASTNNEISVTLSRVTSRVNLTVSTVMPKNSIRVVGATPFWTDSSNPHFANHPPKAS